MRTLPPLPEKKMVVTIIEGRTVEITGYSREQMQAYALAEREECAKEAERHSTYKNDTPNSIAKSIRARS